MMTDPIADLLTQIRNGYMAKKVNVAVPHSKLKENLVQLLSKAGYLGKIQTQKEGKVKKVLLINLVYVGKEPKLTNIVRVSRIARRNYVTKNQIPKVLGGLGISVISTINGLMTDAEARKRKLGGEIICKVW